MEIFLNFIKSNYSSALTILITITTTFIPTYLVSRYNALKPRKLDIQEKQLNYVYLPLTKLVKQYLYPDIETCRKNLPLFIKKVNKLFYANYQYLYPKTLKMFEVLKEEASKAEPSAFVIASFKDQTIHDYELLKHALGYPTNSFFEFIKHLTKFERAMRLTEIFLIVFLFFYITFSILEIINGNFIYIVPACVYSLLIIVLISIVHTLSNR